MLSHRKYGIWKYTELIHLWEFLSGYYVERLIFLSFIVVRKDPQCGSSCGRAEGVGRCPGEPPNPLSSLLLTLSQRAEAEAGRRRQQVQHPLEAPEVRGALLHALLLALHLPRQQQAPLWGLRVQRLQELLLLPEAREGLGLLRLPASQVSGTHLPATSRTSSD